MRKWLRPAWIIAIAICVAMMFSGCASEPELELAEEPTSYLDVYRPLLQEWMLESEADWSALPRYDISVELDVAALKLAGTETVRFTNRSELSLQEICFRLYPNVLWMGTPLTVSSVTSSGFAVDHEIADAGTVLEIDCDPPVEPGQFVDLEIDFALDIPEVSSGWVLLGHSQNIFSLPDFYPILAVHDGSQWHRDIAPAFADAGFADSAFYHVSLLAPSDQVVVSTGMTISQTKQSDGMTETEFIAGPIREFVILASPDYEVQSVKVMGTVVQSYYLSEDRTAGESALYRAASALEVYSDLYGPYPYTVMNVTEAPLQFKGMEFSTLNLLGIDLYRAHRKDLRYLTVHEVAHQWWYSQVGSDPFNAPWLDEGLAEYSGYVYYWKTYGRERADLLREQRWESALEYSRATDSDVVLANPVTSYSNPKTYEAMAYAKGALFFDTLRRAVGDDTYFAILQEYVRRYRFQNALPEDFFSVARDVSGRDLTPLINEWILSAE